MGKRHKIKGPLHRADAVDIARLKDEGMDVTRHSHYHYKVCGEGWYVDWWPASGKWMLPPYRVRIGGFEKLIEDCKAHRDQVQAERAAKAAKPSEPALDDPPGLKDLDARTGAYSDC